MSADGSQTQEVSVEGSQQESLAIQEGDTVSRVTKRTVLRSQGDRTEVGMSIRQWVGFQVRGGCCPLGGWMEVGWTDG